MGLKVDLFLVFWLLDFLYIIAHKIIVSFDSIFP
jgi:hypothetical protein